MYREPFLMKFFLFSIQFSIKITRTDEKFSQKLITPNVSNIDIKLSHFDTIYYNERKNLITKKEFFVDNLLIFNYIKLKATNLHLPLSKLIVLTKFFFKNSVPIISLTKEYHLQPPQ